jgi:hypothetical protein
MFRNSQKGQSIVIMAVGIVILVLFAALAIDAGNAYTAKREAQNAADAAALAGTRQLVTECSGEGAPSEADILTSIANLAQVNYEGVTAEAYYVKEDGSPLNASPLPLGAVPCGCGVNSARGVQVNITGARDSFFAGLMGQQSMEVKAEAKARYAPITSPDSNVYPVTRCDPTQVANCPDMTMGQIVPLRMVSFDESDPGAQYGNFGWLTWSGDNSAATAGQSMTPPGTYHNPNFPGMDYFNPGEPRYQGNTVKWDVNPDPNDHQLAVGKWVQGAPGNMATINAELEEYWVGKDRAMIIPVYNDAVGRGQNSGYLVSNFAAFKITCANLGGGGNRLGTCQYLDDFPPNEKWLEGYFLGYTTVGAWTQGCVPGGVNTVNLIP